MKSNISHKKDWRASYWVSIVFWNYLLHDSDVTVFQFTFHMPNAVLNGLEMGMLFRYQVEQ